MEEGRCGPFRATLALSFEDTSEGCRVVADFVVRGLGTGPVVELLGRRAVASDLRRAAALVQRG